MFHLTSSDQIEMIKETELIEQIIFQIKFDNISKIKTLKIKLGWLIQINSDIFKNFQSLTKLDMSGSKITQLEAYCFKGLHALKMLDISGCNYISEIHILEER